MVRSGLCHLLPMRASSVGHVMLMPPTAMHANTLEAMCEQIARLETHVGGSLNADTTLSIEWQRLAMNLVFSGVHLKVVISWLRIELLPSQLRTRPSLRNSRARSSPFEGRSHC